MSLDLNDAGEQRTRGEVIPDGSFVRLVMHLKPGGANIPNQDPSDANLFKASNSSDAVGLDAEFTVVRGQHQGRKLYSFLTVAGGSVDEKGQSKGWLMTKPTIRAMVDSCLALDPKDTSEQAKAARRLQGFGQLHGIEFWAKLGIEPGQEIIDKVTGQRTGRFYDPKNTIERVVVPGDAEFAPLQAGQDVPPKPSGQAHAHPAAAAPAAVQAAAKPAWGNGIAPAAQAAPIAAAAPQQPAPAAATPAAAPQAGPAWLRS